MVGRRDLQACLLAASILATADEQAAGILGIFVFLRPGMTDESPKP